eukprot:gene22700-biopygen1196
MAGDARRGPPGAPGSRWTLADPGIPGGAGFRRRWPVGVHGGPGMVEHLFGKIQRRTCQSNHDQPSPPGILGGLAAPVSPQGSGSPGELLSGGSRGSRENRNHRDYRRNTLGSEGPGRDRRLRRGTTASRRRAFFRTMPCQAPASMRRSPFEHILGYEVSQEVFALSLGSNGTARARSASVALNAIVRPASASGPRPLPFLPAGSGGTGHGESSPLPSRDHMDQSTVSCS